MQTLLFNLLQQTDPFCEENGPSKHSWAKFSDAGCFQGPGLRVWDINSGSHPDQTGRMQALINPNVRIAKGLPMIKMESELRHYEVQDPYGKDYAYYKDEYLCLWEVTPDEIVKRWDWDDLVENENWYEDEILPAFEEQNDQFLRRSQTGPAFDMSTLQSNLPEIPPVSVSRDALSESDMDDCSNSDPYANGDWNTSSEEDNWQIDVDRFWDTDNEAEESNAIDNGYNILEGVANIYQD
ncbi:unnamed protein product [Penicillium manginii]